MGLVSAEERRAQAREVALRLLGERRFENVSLRDVARELGVPLSTLTYTYSAVTDLLDDFDGYVDVPARARVGSGGLRVELLRYVDEAFAVLTEQPGPREIWRYRLSQVGRGFLEPGLDRMEEMIATIRVLGGESYRLPDRELGHMFRCMTIGSLLHWLDSGPRTTLSGTSHCSSRSRCWCSLRIHSRSARARRPRPHRRTPTTAPGRSPRRRTETPVGIGHPIRTQSFPGSGRGQRRSSRR